MNEPILLERQRTLVRDLTRLAADRARLEPALAESYATKMEAAEQEYARACADLRAHLVREREALDREWQQRRQKIERRVTKTRETAKHELANGRTALEERLEKETEAAEADFHEITFAIDAGLEAARTAAHTKLHEDNVRLAAKKEELEGFGNQARELLREWNQPFEDYDEAARATAKKRPLRKLADCTQEVTDNLARLQGLASPRYARVHWMVSAAVVPWLVLILPLGWMLARALMPEPSLVDLFAIGAGASFVVTVILYIIGHATFTSYVHRQVEDLYVPLAEALVDSEASRQYLLERAQKEHDQALVDGQARYTKDLNAEQAKHEKKLTDLERARTHGLATLDNTYQAHLESIAKQQADQSAEAEQRHTVGCTTVAEQFDKDKHQLDETHRARLDEIRTRHVREWETLRDRWQNVVASSLTSAEEVRAESARLFPAWDDPHWLNWPPPTTFAPGAFRFGSFQMQTESVVATEPWVSKRPSPVATTLELPALCAYPEPNSILFHGHDEGRARAIEALRMIMLRTLTSLPPGKVKFLIVDPVGLGQNFAAFMNLADYDESLVGSRIWTEAAHIEQRLADMTAHMENVIQKYLRNRYATISEYNAHAGEVAEPYRIVVVANFPTNFTAEATRRLVSIAQSGARCGVSTLISVDGNQPLPRDFDLADLEAAGVNLVWEDGAFQWRDEDFGKYPLRLDTLPDDDFCNRILQQVGEGARGAHRVEVPFEFIAPAQEKWWTGSTSKIVSVPLGRAGATRRQHLELGKGTSQHALVAGKTGSGKSTLLHALITNLALTYSPEEIELYLVDFKKGVEFKTYAVHELPHARVVAIESEREFGLSVLQRLDTELKRRGERFRAVGAQDLHAYRQAVIDEPSPRILLIVDEFQEFFTEDDRLAQDAAQLLDRLVRQGRAFGIHILLGSQTLGGAYSLARSTIDQMAVRIALQCSEADAHLILSDDNSAARLLSRPGEAIYNDQNGLVEGNDPFQVVWLGDEARERYLGLIRDLARVRPMRKLPTVVFEGNAAADVSKNPQLMRVLNDGVAPEEETAWLGEAMAIDELTTAVFRRQNGSNLLIVGQQTEAVLGMFTTALISLAAQGRGAMQEGGIPRFWVIDGQQGDAPRTGVLPRFPDLLGEPVRVTGTRELPRVMAELSAELERRQSSPEAEVPSIYVVLHGVQRMRDLRRAEEDFSFMSKSEDAAPTPDKQLATLLREGATLGIHVLLWCDTLNNLQRVLDRQGMREFALRVVFQMNVADSSNLIDTPAAAKLGMHRALYVSEEEGRMEKFRPYGVPAEVWLGWVQEQLRKRGGLVPAG